MLGAVAQCVYLAMPRGAVADVKAIPLPCGLLARVQISGHGVPETARQCRNQFERAGVMLGFAWRPFERLTWLTAYACGVRQPRGELHG